MLKALPHKDDPQAILTTAEVMTIAAVAAEFFVGDPQAALDFLISHRYIKPFSKSRFNRRLHALPESLWQFALAVLSRLHQQADPDRIHIVDTFPVPVRRNIGIRRCKIYRGKAGFPTSLGGGYCAGKKEYYFGLKASLILTARGKPVELLLTPASCADLSARRSRELDLPDGATLLGDGGFLRHRI